MRSAFAGLIFCVAAISFAKQEFWDLREPAEWTSAEVQVLATQSPWAKKVRAEVPPDPAKPMSNFDRTAFGPNGVNREAIAAQSRGIDTVGSATGVSGPSPQRPVAAGALAFYGETLIRWESAAPIAALMKLPLVANSYSISVTGLPAPLIQSLEAGGLKSFAGTSLKFKGGGPIGANTIFLTTDKRTIVFGFPMGSNPVVNPEGTATFALNAQGLRLTAGFELKSMLFRGKLAL